MINRRYLKRFETHQDYDFYMMQVGIVPNVSFCDDKSELHFNPTKAKIVCTFNVSDITSPTQIMNSVAIDGDYFSEVEIDGVLQPSVSDTYSFGTDGKHVVKYTLNDRETLGESAFEGCDDIAIVKIPNSVMTIEGFAFSGCTNLEKIIIPSSVTEIKTYVFSGCTNLKDITLPSLSKIGSYAFEGCSSLESITCLSEWSPVIQSDTFQNVKTGGTLYVPRGSDYSVWMGNGNYYLGLYNWTKIEQ